MYMHLVSGQIEAEDPMMQKFFRGNQTVSPLTPSERCKTLAEPWLEGFCGSVVRLAEKHHAFSRRLLGALLGAWSGLLTHGLEMAPQQHQEETAALLWIGRTYVLGAVSGLEDWVVVCACDLKAGVPVRRQRPRRTLWKAFLNSRLKHG